MGKAGIKKGKSPIGFLLIFAVIWLTVYGFLMFPIHLLMFTGTQVSGVVTDVIVHEDDDDGDTYEPVVKYACGGITTTQKQGYSSSVHYHVGEKVTIYCNESNPTKFAIKSFGNYMMLLFPLIGLFIGFLGVKSLYEEIKRRKLKNKLSQNGVHIEAIISEIKDTRARMNNITGYKIIANCNGRIFTSETIYAALQYILKEGDKIDVYIDPINPDDYWMDTDSIFNRPIIDNFVPNNSINNSPSQNFTQNSSENVFSDTVLTSTTNNTTSITPNPPKISDKKCPIHRINDGYGVGIVFLLIGGGFLVSFLINTVSVIRTQGLNPSVMESPAILSAGIFLIIGIIILIPKIKRSRKKKRLMEGGVKKEAMVTEISHNHTTINNQKGYTITAIYDGKLYKSTAIYADIYYLIEEGDEIDIYVGTGGDEDYRVDIDSIFYREPKPSYYDSPRSIGDIFNFIKETITNNKTD